MKASPAEEDFIPTRETLLCRLRNWDDHESWKDFFDIYGRLIYATAAKAGLNKAQAEDVVQETLISVAKQMPGFKYDRKLGSFKGWLLQITRRRIWDHFRNRPGELQMAGETHLQPDHSASSAPSIDEFWECEWQSNLLLAAVNRVKARVHLKQFQMFDLYVTQEWPMEQVIRTMGVNSAQVYMAKYRISALIKRELKALSDQD